MLSLYSRFLTKKPLLTNCLTSSTIIMSGDTICQIMTNNDKPFDKERTLRFGIYGLLVLAPIVRGWYVTLDRIFPGNNKINAIKKLACDQIFFAPFIQGIGLVSIEYMKSRNFEKVKDNYRRNYYELMINAYKLWPLAQSINFFLIPLKFRLVFGSFVALFWNIYFTYKVSN